MDLPRPIVTETESGDVLLRVPGTDVQVVADTVGRALDEYADFLILAGYREAA